MKHLSTWKEHILGTSVWIANDMIIPLLLKVSLNANLRCLKKSLLKVNSISNTNMSKLLYKH